MPLSAIGSTSYRPAGLLALALYWPAGQPASLHISLPYITLTMHTDSRAIFRMWLENPAVVCTTEYGGWLKLLQGTSVTPEAIGYNNFN